ncbi:MAG: hypothetical protein ABH865_07770 [Candidatus Omnitrophota bacterium]|nr:hypothetical protein [Candidatus Omnitrophota bacterium]
MAKRNVGLYLGVNSVGGVVVENRKIVAYAKYDVSAVEEEAKIERLSEEIRWEALVNKVLRDIGAAEKDVRVSLSDKDFIFRFLDMPLMKKKEIESSLVYEVAKYIPFKIDELRWGYGYTTFARDRKINLSFVGIKDNNFVKVTDILTRLGLNVVTVEPSSLSLVRVLKTSKAHAAVKNFALLDFTSSEAYLTFFYHDLPLFNRYLAIPLKEGKIDFEKFIDAVRMSFQYFKREFDFYDVEKFIVVGGAGVENIAPFFKEELQTDAVVVSPSELLDKPGCEVEHVKALGVAGFDYYPYSFKPLLTKKEDVIIPRAGAPKEIPLNIGLLLALIGIGLLVVFLFAAFTGSTISTEKASLRIEESKIMIPRELADLSWEQREEKVIEKENNLLELQTLQGSLMKSSPLFERIAFCMPEGFWLDTLKVALGPQGKYTVTMHGFGFLSDANLERLAIDGLVSKLKKDDALTGMFENIDLISTQRQEIRQFMVTSFTVKME